MDNEELAHRHALYRESLLAPPSLYRDLPVRCCATGHRKQVQEAQSLPFLTQSLRHGAQRCIGRGTYCFGFSREMEAPHAEALPRQCLTL